MASYSKLTAESLRRLLGGLQSEQNVDPLDLAEQGLMDEVPNRAMPFDSASFNLDDSAENLIDGCRQLDLPDASCQSLTLGERDKIDDPKRSRSLLNNDSNAGPSTRAKSLSSSPMVIVDLDVYEADIGHNLVGLGAALDVNQEYDGKNGDDIDLHTAEEDPHVPQPIDGPIDDDDDA